MLDRFLSLPAHLSATPLFAVALSLLAFGIAFFVTQKLKNPIWLPPLIASMFIVALVLWLFKIDFNTYKKGAYVIEFFLAPATVALAIPMYQQFYHIRKLFFPILISLVSGGLVAVISVVLLAKIFGLDYLLAASLAPKSVTAPIAIGISKSLDALPSLSISAVLIAGIITSFGAPILAKIMRIENPSIIGFAMGLNGHAFATSKAFEINHKAGAFSSLAMATTGIYTAIFLPFAKGILEYFFS